MAVLTIRTAPDPVLRQKAARVTAIDRAVQKLIDDLFETMDAAHGVGLAANQVGVPLRVLVMGIPDEDEEGKVHRYALINPEFIKKSDEKVMEEGCLSVPGYRGDVLRAERVKVKALDREGREMRLKASGLMAQALQHEIDHLDGILYLDRLKEQGALETLRPIETRETTEIAAA